MGTVWQHIQEIPQHSFICGHCGKDVASHEGWARHGKGEFIFLCPACDKPTYIVDNQGAIHLQVPGPLPGRLIRNVPTDANEFYEEARRCVRSNCFTAAVMICRKILMHVAVDLKAPQNQTFADYVAYLCNKGYIPPNGTGWVDFIRKKANEANHEVVVMGKPEAELLLALVAHLLMSIYELPSMVPASP
jgi:hypothetical protein